MKEYGHSILMYPKDLPRFLGMSQPQVYRVRCTKGFPAPRYPTGKRPMYLTEEIIEWARNLNAKEVLKP